MAGTLPFSAFLDLMRARGYGVGLREYVAFAHLLKRWDGALGDEFADAVGALLGRSAEEVESIRRLFVELYLPDRARVPAPATPAEREVEDRWAFLKRRPWAIAGLLASAVIVALAVQLSRPRPAPPSQPEPPASPSASAPAAPAAGFAPIPPPLPAPPRVPDPPVLLDRRTAAAIVSLGFLFVLAASWWAKASEARRRWVRDAWSAALAALPGPHHFSIVAARSASSFARQDIEDAATVLGRAFSQTPSRELDVARTLRLTLRRSLLPQLAFKERRISRTILVFQDVSLSMRVWAAKVNALVVDLRRQGVAIERWYFDGDPARVTDRPKGPPAALDALLRRNPDAAIMIVSAGTGLAASLEKTDIAWLRALAASRRRTWLTPVSDLRLWPESFAGLPLNVWPMTREGLGHAARDLAGLEGDPVDRVLPRLAVAGRAEADDVERLKRLASLVPNPPLELLEALRREFAADVPDAAIAHLLSAGGPAAATVLRLDDAETRRCLTAVRLETPQLEANVRRTLLTWLQASRPVAGSIGHERWTLAVAVQELMLADLSGDDVSGPLSTIRALAQGPLWEEVGHALRLLPGSAAVADSIAAVATSIAGPPRAAPPASRAPMFSRFAPAWPGVRELVPAAIVASIVLVGGRWLQAFPTRTVAHIDGAYVVEYIPAGGTAGRLSLRKSPTVAAPAEANVYQDEALFRARVALATGEATGVALNSNDTGHFYQVRTTLPDGNLALSNAVWVPSDRLVTVAIDAAPWANVTVQGSAVTVGPEPTPMSAQLLPGRYRVHFENGGVTPPMDQDIEVTPTNRSFRVVMPGFDPARTAGDLLGPPPGR